MKEDLVAAPVHVATAALVSGLSDEVSEQSLKRYIGNKKRSKGGPVRKVERLSPKKAVVYFEDIDSKFSRFLIICKMINMFFFPF